MTCLVGLPEESSEDEPLINLVKKNRTDKQTKSKTKASALEKRDTTPEKPRKMLVSGKEPGPASLGQVEVTEMQMHNTNSGSFQKATPFTG